jgi:hypothetical protein
VEERDSKNHKISDGSMVLALRKTPSPLDGEWKEMPIDEF